MAWLTCTLFSRWALPATVLPAIVILCLATAAPATEEQPPDVSDEAVTEPIEEPVVEENAGEATALADAVGPTPRGLRTVEAESALEAELNAQPGINVGDLIEEDDAPSLNEDSPAASPLAFLPPLSLRDCLVLIERVHSHIPEETGHPLPADVSVNALRRIVISTYNYLTFRDDLHTSLAHYNWVRLHHARVDHTPEAYDTDDFVFSPPRLHISAVSFEVERGDVWLHRVLVYDENGNLRQEFTLDPPRLLQHSLPRREVFHLWRRTTISRIQVQYSQANPTAENRPRVIIRGGITDKREYIKTAIFYLKNCLVALDNSDWSHARYLLEEATDNIEEYIRRNQMIQ